MMSKFKNKLVPSVVTLILFLMLHDCYGQSLNLYLSQIEKSDFPEIKLFVDVLDNTNKPVKTLKRSNFELSEDEEPVEIISFAAPGTPRPLTTVLILDRSGSMDKDNKLIRMKEAARTYVSLLKENDYTCLIVFDDSIKELQSFTNKKDILYNNINSIRSGGATAFYDAVYKGIKNLIPIRGHKVVLALTDGMDNKSWKSIEKTIKLSVKHGIPVLTIGLGSKEKSGQEGGIYEPPLKLLTEKTGGRYYYAPNAAQLTKIYRNIAIMLQSSYEMTYISTNQIKDGTTREVIVSMSNDIVSTNGANSYYIPGVIVPGSSWPVFLGILFPLIILLFAPQLLKRYKFSTSKKEKLKPK